MVLLHFLPPSPPLAAVYGRTRGVQCSASRSEINLLIYKSLNTKSRDPETGGDHFTAFFLSVALSLLVSNKFRFRASRLVFF